jgi:hypothetical protein
MLSGKEIQYSLGILGGGRCSFRPKLMVIWLLCVDESEEINGLGAF